MMKTAILRTGIPINHLKTRREDHNMHRKQCELIADEFWTAAGGREQFPRQLESPVLWALPVAVIKLPRLWVSDVEAWLIEKGIRFRFETANRRLHGSLLAYRGRGCILLDGSDSGSELRYSLAHETAHFILNYLRPRRKAASLLGPAVLEVFDGLRPPTVRERVHGILSRVPIGFHVHLMERTFNGNVNREILMEIEDSADLLALEIISPEEEVRRRVARFSNQTQRGKPMEIAAELLQEEFGLPSGVAESYAQHLYPMVRPFSAREWLRQRE
jgi:Zn-dependent peptidase ImmA (M78 family)